MTSSPRSAIPNLTTNDEIAKVHLFLLESGVIGASGRHDPKRILIDGVQYRQFKGPDTNRDPKAVWSVCWLSPRRHPDGEKLVAQIFTSWNPLVSWLHHIDALRSAA